MRCPSCSGENPSGAHFCMTCGMSMAASEETAPPVQATATSIPASGDFVGRQRELGELTSALDDAIAGRGRLVMLVGEPGIGKTRTARELSTIAEQRGAQALWGRCYEGEGAPPYWPWVQPIRAYVQQAEAERLRSEMGPGAADIAEIVPEVKDRLPDLEPPSALDSPESARFRLFDSVTNFLKRASENQPLVLVLDNLHWADRSSLLLLEFLTQEIGSSRLLVLGTYRDVDVSRHDPLSQALGNLIREQSFHRVQLRGLSQKEVEQFAETVTGAGLAPALAQAVHARTEGNPLFVGEVVRLLAQEGQEGNPEADIRIPEGVRDAIGRRLNLLSEECNRALTVASVVGREFTLELLVRLIDDSPQNKLLDILEEGLAAKVIEELPPVVGRYQFSHALVQRTLLDELSLTRRVQLHARIAETMEELYEYDAEAHAAELAHHFAEAQTLLGIERLVKYSKMAGDQALANFAHSEALSHFQRALAAMEGQPMNVETAEILFGLGRAQVAILQEREAEDSLTRAFDFYVESKQLAQAMAIVESLPPGTGLIGFTDITLRALELVQPESLQEGRLLCRYGVSLGHELKDFDGAKSAFDRALEIARREGDAALEMRTLAAAADVVGWQLRFKEALELSLKAIELSNYVEDLYAEALARTWANVCLTATGEPKRARPHGEACLSVAEKLRDNYRLGVALWSRQLPDSYSGNWNEAREYGIRGILESPREPRILCTQAVIEYQVGDYDRGKEYLERVLELPHTSMAGPIEQKLSHAASAISTIGYITGNSEHLDTAESAAKEALITPVVAPITEFLARNSLALIAAQRGDVDLAQQQYVSLNSAKAIMIISCCDRLLGLLAQTMGNLDDAQAHFEDALAFCRKAGYRPELAWSLYDYAGMLLERNNEGDHEKAVSLLDESLAISTELGMKPLRDKVLALQEKASSQPVKPPAYPDGLTQREVEVLRLVAAGRSNPEIAQELFISINTVVRHLSNIFSKTGTTNRVEAATYANSRGLV